MENIKGRIDKDMINSLKNKQQEILGVLRMLKSEIKNKEIELKRELKDNELISLLRSQIKLRKEARDQFEKANRKDLRDKEEGEIKIIQGFLPAEIDLKELEDIVKKVIKETKAQSTADLGRIMPIVIKKVKGRAGGQEIKDIALSILK